MTTFIPVAQNAIISDSVFESQMAGGFLTSELKNRVNRKYSNLLLNNYIPKILKENHVRICEDFQRVEKRIIYKHQFMSQFIELPDKNKICLNEELFEVGEILFSPQLFGFDYLSLAQVLSKALKVGGNNRRIPRST